MIPASYLYKDALRQNWGRDFTKGETPSTGPELPAPFRIRTAQQLFDLAFGPKRGR